MINRKGIIRACQRLLNDQELRRLLAYRRRLQLTRQTNRIGAFSRFAGGPGRNYIFSLAFLELHLVEIAIHIQSKTNNLQKSI